MAFNREVATGEALIGLTDSESIKDFNGVVLKEAGAGPQSVAEELKPARDNWQPKWVIAVDGSNVNETVQNGFPSADASLVTLSVVFIDISKLKMNSPGEILRPRVFREMEKAKSLDAVLPGANVVRKDVANDDPQSWFREEIFKTLQGKIAGHETLFQTFEHLTQGEPRRIKCPILPDCDCKEDELIQILKGINPAACKENKFVFETDSLRLHERFKPEGNNGEPHGEFRHVLEILALLNVVRFFSENEKLVRFLDDVVFVLDGPLGIFGNPAWLRAPIINEFKRIENHLKGLSLKGLCLFGFEKSGQYYNHFQQLDWTDEGGPKTKYEAQTILAPDSEYVNKYITFKPPGSRPSGYNTYFGRKLLYKTKSLQHAVVCSPMTNEKSLDFNNVELEAFPRLGDILNVVDELSTYLFENGFEPLIRAHAHAAIPLKRGQKILEGLFNP